MVLHVNAYIPTQLNKFRLHTLCRDTDFPLPVSCQGPQLQHYYSHQSQLNIDLYGEYYDVAITVMFFNNNRLCITLLLYKQIHV